MNGAHAGALLLYTGSVVEVLTKRFRVTDKALVVYEGNQITAIKYADGSNWCIWNRETGQWQKATPDEARSFERLPMVGHLDN